MTILKTRGLTKIYENGNQVVKALRGVDIEIKQGEFVAIVGTSGSGKSTLLHLLGGLDNATEGEVIVNDRVLSNLSDDERCVFRRRYIGFVFQSYNLVPVLTVNENILLPIELDGQKVEESYIENILKVLGLTEKKYAYPNQLSGGQQQRVAIGRALASKPAIILADEPTGNLDSQTSLEVIGLLKVTSQQFNQTIVMITHNNQLAQMADRIIRLEDGLIMEVPHDAQ